MLKDYPATQPSTAAGAGLNVPRTGVRSVNADMVAWRYSAGSRRKGAMIFAVLASIGLHVSLFLFVGPGKQGPAKVVKDETPMIQIAMPELIEEEPERVISESDEPVESASFVPMQADLPQVARPEDFVQKIDVNSLLERPDMSDAKVFAVPENINRGALRQNIGTVFNLNDLDRRPEPIVRPPPVFPAALKREVTTATVRVRFIVDSNGEVVNAGVVETTHPGFNDAALTGVGKWKFRAGMKNGRRVNTRMEVPIVFSVSADD